MPVPVQIARRDIDPPTLGRNGYQGFLNHKSEVLPKGWNGFNSFPLPCDILAEHDVGVKVRDGCTLYMDIYRSPTTGPNEKVPAIISWSPFGKKLNGIKFLEMMTPYNVGVSPGRLSGLEKFEGPDPAQYVPRGYAVINVDARGVGDSDGMCVIMGTQEGEDGYDVIEEIAKMDWCNGSVGLAGNSHLAIVQWFIAQLQPPSLKAIAPWEACGDLFREQFLRGGIYDGDFFDHISGVMIQGHDGMESFKEMARRQPLANAYWNDKRPDMTKIKIPSYVTGSFSSGLHTMGSIRGYMQIDCPDKWLRFCPYQEWYDIWEDKQSVDELGQFFDRYLKGEQNGWEKTPRVRMTALPFGDKDARANIVVEDFPIPNTDYRELYFGSDGSLNDKVPAKSGMVSYNSEKPGSKCTFSYTFKEQTYLIGMLKAVVFASCDDLNDMDIYVMVRKLDANGKVLLSITVPWDSIPPKSVDEIPKDKQTGVLMYMGPLGMLRASHREIDPSKSMHPQYPFHPHEREQKIPPGQVVEVEIGISAIGQSYEAGETLQVWVCGQTPQMHAFNELEGKKGYSLNKGTHKIHCGPEHPSRIILPFVKV